MFGDNEDEAPTPVDKFRLRLMYNGTENKVHSSCIIRDGREVLGAWGTVDGRNRSRTDECASSAPLTAIMAQFIVEGATKRVVQDLRAQGTNQELIEWLVWRLGAITTVLVLGVVVGLCLSPSKGLLVGLSGVLRALHSGLHTVELQPLDIVIQQPLKHSIKHQAMQFSAESVCRNDAVLDMRFSTMKRLMAHWVLHACAEVQKKNTSITTKAWRHLSWTFEEAPRLAARATREHLNGILYDATDVEQEEPPEEADLIFHDDDNDGDDAEDPESTGTAVAEASEPFPTVAAEAARAERFLYLRCAYGKHPPKP